MKIITAAFALAAATAFASAGAAKDPPKSGNVQAVADLRLALDAMVQSKGAPPGQANKKVDPDQGDDHASPRAIAVVCSKDNPAAERSAICPTPISPD